MGTKPSYNGIHTMIKPFIFLHNPRTGGISIKTALSQFPEFHWYGHLHGLNIRDNWAKEKWDKSFKFIFVRNPWERLVSFYEYHNLRSKENKDFKKWIMEKVIHGQIDRHGAHGLNQWQYFTDEEDNIIIDFVGRYENLQEDFKTICDTIGFTNVNLPYVNTSRHRDYIEYYDDESREAISNFSKKVINYFGYSFEDRK